MSKKTYDVFTDTEKLTIIGDGIESSYDKYGRLNGCIIKFGSDIAAWLPPTAIIIERKALLSWDKHGHSIVPKNS